MWLVRNFRGLYISSEYKRLAGKMFPSYHYNNSGGVIERTHLQNPATDVPVAGLAFDAKLGVVVRFTVWNAIPVRKIQAMRHGKRRGK